MATDDEIRRLEREAAGGDFLAAEKLAWARARMRTAPFPELTIGHKTDIYIPDGKRTPIKWDQAISAWTPYERGKYVIRLEIVLDNPGLVELDVQTSTCRREFNSAYGGSESMTMIAWLDPVPTALQVFVTQQNRPAIQPFVRIIKAKLRIQRQDGAELLNHKPEWHGPYERHERRRR